MANVGIVILNYLNYKDTIECVESIFEMQYNIAGIVIVDNHSDNESYEVLKNKYRNDKNVIIVKTRKNYGYAKGNNIGIRIVQKKFNAGFVFVVNNDVLFLKKDFFEKLLQNYHPGIGVMGSEIHVRGDNVQNYFAEYVGLRDNILLYINDYFESKGLARVTDLFPQIRLGQVHRVLHGCGLMFTPDFLKYYDGFYSKTFLYGEEVILYYMCKLKNLKQVYVDSTYLYHKEDQSSKQSFQNRSSIMSRYRRQSRKYVIWWIIKDRMNMKFQNIQQLKNI